MMVEESKKILPLGEDDFRTIRERENYYVDKTLMIKDFINDGNKVTLITRPRRFGKTLNMTMLRDFFDMTQDSHNIFEGLTIMETEYVDQMNSIPVIYLSFKECTGVSLKDLKKAIAEEVRKEYIRYKPYFADVDKKDKRYLRYFKMLELLEHDEVKDAVLKQCLVCLIKALHTRYDVRPILLIDEYDNLIVEAHEKVRKKFTSFYALFLITVLKGNPSLGQAVLTGIQCVAKESLFSMLNNMAVYTVLDAQYAKYFGLTEEQTIELLTYYDLELDDDVKAYYDGYLFSNIKIYNPWSILSYAQKKKLNNYWLKTSTNTLIHESVDSSEHEFHEEFEKLIINEEVTVSVNLETSFIEIPKTETLWGLFVNAGYLTVIHEDYELEILTIKIPNNEIRSEFRKLVSTYTELSNERLQSMRIALTEGDMTAFCKVFEKLVRESINHQNSKENAYHMLVLGMVMYLRDLYDITNNIESDPNKSNIIMKSTDPNRPHIMIELKQGKNLGKLKHKVLKQIEEKNDDTELTGSVLCIGIAHNKKKCELVHEMMAV